MVRVLTTDKPTGLHTSTINALLHIIKAHPNGFEILQVRHGELMLRSKGIELRIKSDYLIDRLNDFNKCIADKNKQSAEWFKYIY